MQAKAAEISIRAGERGHDAQLLEERKRGLWGRYPDSTLQEGLCGACLQLLQQMGGDRGLAVNACGQLRAQGHDVNVVIGRQVAVLIRVRILHPKAAQAEGQGL